MSLQDTSATKKHTSTCSMCHPNALNGKWGDRTLAMADET